MLHVLPIGRTTIGHDYNKLVTTNSAAGETVLPFSYQWYVKLPKANCD
jgi:hypothetical protein